MQGHERPVALAFGIVAIVLLGADWPQFRGPHGTASTTDASVPVRWSDSQNLKWKAALPGPGASSPVVVDGRVFVTSYSGYGVDDSDPGDPANLKRHLVCVDRATGREVWSRSVDAVLPEDPYSGFLTQHGYASSTPVTDGERVYVFFGKTGVLACDMDGNWLWQTGVGTESSGRRWGSAASPILYQDLLIVNASDESQSVRALEKKSGNEVWKAQAAGLELSFSTPVLVDLADGRTEIVIAVPGELWGLNPDSGKLNWYAEVDLPGNVCPTPVVHGDVVYAVGGRNGGSAAVRAGGDGDVTETHVLWSGRAGSYVPSPVLHDGRLHWVDDRGVAHGLDARTGELIYRERLGVSDGGFGGRPFYASVVAAGDRLYAVSRTSGTFVLAGGPEFRQLARNRFASDQSDFNATPAVADGQLFLRSNRFLYCVAER